MEITKDKNGPKGTKVTVTAGKSRCNITNTTVFAMLHTVLVILIQKYKLRGITKTSSSKTQVKK